MRFQSPKKMFEVPSARGHQAILVRIDDVGEQKTVFKGVEKIRPKAVVTWELDECDSKGRPFVMFSIVPQTLAGSTNNMRSIVEAIFRRVLTEQECQVGVDETDLIGKVAYLHVAVSEKDPAKRVIARIDPIQSDSNLKIRGDYTEESGFVRRIRENAVGSSGPSDEGDASEGGTGEDLPF